MAYGINLKKYGRVLKGYSAESKREAEKYAEELKAKGYAVEIISLKSRKAKLEKVI